MLALTIRERGIEEREEKKRDRGGGLYVRREKDRSKHEEKVIGEGHGKNSKLFIRKEDEKYREK